MERFFIDTGSMDNIRKGAITRLVCEKAGIRSEQIGKIEIMREFSFFDVEQHIAKDVLKSLKGAKLDGRNVLVQPAEKAKTKNKVKRK